MTGDLVRQKCVILAQRHPGMTERIRDLAETLFESVIMVSEDTSLFDAVTKLQPDLVVIDLSFPVSGRTGVVSFLRPAGQTTDVNNPRGDAERRREKIQIMMYDDLGVRQTEIPNETVFC